MHGRFAGAAHDVMVDPECPLHGGYVTRSGGRDIEFDPVDPGYGFGGLPPRWGGRAGESMVDPACPLHGRFSLRVAGTAAVDPACPVHGRFGAPGRVAGDSVPRRVELKNRGVGTAYARIYKIRDAWSCVFSSCPKESLGSLSEVIAVPAGASGTTLLSYQYPLLYPTQVVRVYWRGTAEELPESGPSGDLKANNARIRLGVSTVDIGKQVTTGGAGTHTASRRRAAPRPAAHPVRRCAATVAPTRRRRQTTVLPARRR